MYRFYKDIIYNIFSTFLLVSVVQFLIYPLLANMLSIDEYGLFLITMGTINFISVGLASALGNMRLLNQKKYVYTNNYNYLLVIVFGILFATFTIFSLVFQNYKFDISYLILTLIMLYKIYHTYSFRLEINYSKILFLNILITVGYLVGIIMYISFDTEWIVIFLIGEVFGVIYLLLNAKTTKEKISLKINAAPSNFYGQYYSLSIGSLLSNSLMYLDRMLLFPLLGAKGVTIFVVASFVGKSLGLVTAPINSVVLTYITKKNMFNFDVFKRLYIWLWVVFLLIYLLLTIVANQVTYLLYPSVYDEVRDYINIASASSLLFIFGNIIHTFLLKMCHEKWQLRSHLLYLVLYVLLGYLTITYSNLFYFIWFTIILNFLRVPFVYFLIKKYKTFK